jgi:hypothetical protein
VLFLPSFVHSVCFAFYSGLHVYRKRQRSAVRGVKYNTAKVFTNSLDDSSKEQIEKLCNQSFADL